MTAPALPKDDGGELRRSFTSAKLNILDCISMDPRRTPTEFLVAFRLAQHANGETGAIFPSQQTIAEQIGKPVRTVRAAIAGLKRKGWLVVRKGGFNKPNYYQFDDRHVNAILDRATTLADARREEREAKRLTARRQPVATHIDLTGNYLPVPVGNQMPPVSGNQMPPNTLRGTPEGEHLKDSSSGEEGNAYARAANGW